jgi:hypothetical protein
MNEVPAMLASLTKRSFVKQPGPPGSYMRLVGKGVMHGGAADA